MGNRITISEGTDRKAGKISFLLLGIEMIASIELLRFNERDRTIFIFAGEELQIQLSRDGTWRFIT